MSLVLAKAIQNGDVSTIRNMIQNNIDVNQRGPTDFRLVDFALESDQFEIFKMLLEAGADVNRINSNGMNILHNSILSGKPKYVGALVIDGRSDINSKDSMGNTSLHIASGVNDVQMVRLLVSTMEKSGLDVSIRNGDDKTALEVAARVPYNEIVRVLSGSRSSEEESFMQKLFMDRDIELEGLLNSASKKIDELTSRLESSSSSVSDNALKSEISRLMTENSTSVKSLKLKDSIIEKLRKKNSALQASVLEEKLNHETLLMNFEKMQEELQLTKDISDIKQEMNKLN